MIKYTIPGFVGKFLPGKHKITTKMMKFSAVHKKNMVFLPFLSLKFGKNTEHIAYPVQKSIPKRLMTKWPEHTISYSFIQLFNESMLSSTLAYLISTFAASQK